MPQTVQALQAQDGEELAGKQFCRQGPKEHHQSGDNATLSLGGV